MNQETNSKVVLVGGCFDVLHYGHILFLQAAKEKGTYLIVALEADDNVKKRKGPQRPIHTQVQRKKLLESISFVDEVRMLPFMQHDSDYEALVKEINPAIIALTEGDPYLLNKKKQAAAIQAEIFVVPKVHTPSTSQLAKLIGLE